MAGPQVPKDFRRVIIAAAVGNVIEWYDFYIFGSLAAILSIKFFEKSHPVAALLSTIALFTAGFLIRPLGAFLFGWMGDKVGRKYTFLVTIVPTTTVNPLGRSINGEWAGTATSLLDGGVTADMVKGAVDEMFIQSPYLTAAPPLASRN